MREATNTIRLEGLISEINLRTIQYTNKRTGQPTEALGGDITLLIRQMIDDEEVTLEVPVSMFSPKFTNKGKPHPAYADIEKIMNNYVSIAAGGEEQADRLRVTNAKIGMNEYHVQTGALVSYPRINGSFSQLVSKNDFLPQANFEVEFVIGKMEPELAKDDTETGRLLITGILPQYGGKVDVVPFIVESPKVRKIIESNWQEGDTVAAVGRLNFTSKVVTRTAEVDFGVGPSTQSTIKTSELIIVGGAKDPLSGGREFESADIQKGLADRKARLEAQKERDMARTKSKSEAPPQEPKTNDLGF